MKTTLIALAVVLVLFTIVVASRPSGFRVTRTVVIAAPAQAIFARVNDFRSWGTWSPYEKRDPSMKKSYDGAPSGVGAVYTWAGNSQVGEGRATITESRPGELIRIRLEFVKPFACTNTAEFTFRPEGAQTAVTWSLIGRNTFISKAIGLFVSMETMVGGDFEAGLAQLKARVEAAQPGETRSSR